MLDQANNLNSKIYTPRHCNNFKQYKIRMIG